MCTIVLQMPPFGGPNNKVAPQSHLLDVEWCFHVFWVLCTPRPASLIRGAKPGAPATQRLCLSMLRGTCTQWATTGAPDAFRGATSARRGSGTQGANPGGPAAQCRCSPAPRGSSTEWATAGPLRRPVERNGGPGKRRNLPQNRGGQNQGQRRGHGAAQITQDTMRSRAPGAQSHGNTERQVVDGRSSPQKAATCRNVRREEPVTVQGPVKKQQPDGMSHQGAIQRAVGSTSGQMKRMVHR